MQLRAARATEEQQAAAATASSEALRDQIRLLGEQRPKWIGRASLAAPAELCHRLGATTPARAGHTELGSETGRAVNC